jgi:hypothetical protein
MRRARRCAKLSGQADLHGRAVRAGRHRRIPVAQHYAAHGQIDRPAVHCRFSRGCRHHACRRPGGGSAKRSEDAPQLSTFAESGYPGFEASSWWGILVSANTPPGVIVRLNSELNKALDDNAVKARLLTHGATIKSGTPALAAELMTSEIEQCAKVVKATGARVD